ncbi:LLM class flavin-dependent oxidoreductase [Streptomyces sp. B1I3]|uniref:LLM class flavin-dependent oxidoreductase n=1 Tax=Streptomyces sp. B1I3 TaxID=3042264 RepID=UPI00277E708C|nr:LLM class flavin-dependent oxidoreductase [Streptomyces sp. B1I3]MDQ0792097.1 hypothetical protein [Streptomyces sp. B1I3]
MPDYGHDLLFGTVLVPLAGDGDSAVALVRTADRAGLDLVSVPDHPYQPGMLDAWAALAVIAASTSRVRVFPDVANLPLRPPAVLARTAASLDLLTGGRAEPAWWPRRCAGKSRTGQSKTPVSRRVGRTSRTATHIITVSRWRPAPRTPGRGPRPAPS